MGPTEWPFGRCFFSLLLSDLELGKVASDDYDHHDDCDDHDHYDEKKSSFDRLGKNCIGTYFLRKLTCFPILKIALGCLSSAKQHVFLRKWEERGRVMKEVLKADTNVPPPHYPC